MGRCSDICSTSIERVLQKAERDYDITITYPQEGVSLAALIILRDVAYRIVVRLYEAVTPLHPGVGTSL
jgi:hypothetical protein